MNRGGFETLALFRTKKILKYILLLFRYTLKFITLFKRKYKMHSVWFLSHLLAITVEQILVIVIAFVQKQLPVV